MYRTVMADHFPPTLTITLGDQSLVYRKRTWKLPQADGVLEEKGLRYGENPGQEAALYELINGNLVLGRMSIHPPRPGNGFIHYRNRDDSGGQTSRQDQPDRCG